MLDGIQIPPVKTCIATCIFLFIASFMCIGQPHFEASEKPDWTGYAVCLTIVGAVMLMIHNYSAAFCMIGMNIVFILLKIIKPAEFFAVCLPFLDCLPLLIVLAADSTATLWLRQTL